MYFITSVNIYLPSSQYVQTPTAFKLLRNIVLLLRISIKFPKNYTSNFILVSMFSASYYVL